jgi:two-component system chemotaxis response regulator CheB
VGSFGVAKERIAEQLIPKIKALCHATDSPASASSVPAARVAPFQPVALPRKAPRKFDRINVVVIGSSTGGPNALAELVAHVGEDFPVPILIVQHMPPTFTHFFAKRLDSICGLKVREAGKEERLCAGQVWIAPGDYHITVDREGSSVTARTNQLAHENSCRPSVDVLFRAVARVYGSNALAVVLTGMGQDGLLGCEALSAAGAQIVVQDEKTSVVWGMPGFVAKAGLADAILPLSQIGPEILSRVRSGQQNASSHSRVAVGGK